MVRLILRAILSFSRNFQQYKIPRNIKKLGDCELSQAYPCKKVDSFEA